MISKPSNFDSINENGASRRLPMGAYVAIIKDVVDVPDKQYLEINYDIAEGEYKGIALEAYEAWGRWSHSFRLYYTEKAMWRFKKFIVRCEATNPNFAFDWNNPKCLVNRGIGLVIGFRQYYSSKDGSLKEALDVQDFVTANDIREGKIPNDPKVVAPKNPPVVVAQAADPVEFNSDDLPF